MLSFGRHLTLVDPYILLKSIPIAATGLILLGIGRVFVRFAALANQGLIIPLPLPVNRD